MATETPAKPSPKTRALLWGVILVIALPVGWFIADRVSAYLDARELEEVLEEHAPALVFVAGKTYVLPAFPAPEPGAEVPTFEISLNRFSLRERNFAPQPLPDVRRVIAVGDSTTLGTGVAIGKRFTELLQTTLDARNPKHIEVLNAGKAGMDARSVVRQIQQTVLAFEPSVIIFGAMTADIHDPGRGRRKRGDLGAVEAYGATLESMIALCKERGVQLVFWANTILDTRTDPLIPYQETMVRVGKIHGIDVISLALIYDRQPASKAEQDAFLADKPWTGFWPDYADVPLARAALHLDWAHPNAFGNQRLADSLLPAVERALGMTVALPP